MSRGYFFCLLESFCEAGDVWDFPVGNGHGCADHVHNHIQWTATSVDLPQHFGGGFRGEGLDVICDLYDRLRFVSTDLGGDRCS